MSGTTLSKEDFERFQNINRLVGFDHGMKSGAVEVVFRNLKTRLIQCIEAADMVIGAAAWITDLDILRALAQRPSLLVIQKEDFLRPDLESRLSATEREKLQNAYAAFQRFDGSRVTVGPFSQGVGDDFKNLDPILCFGYFKEGEMFRTPKMHNKFLTFLREKDRSFHPYQVWTGSYNFTKMSEWSLENAVILSDKEIANQYAAEAQIIYLRGEKLNWSQEWISITK